jgi:ABC-type microcin C transport system duplicated ATPase subunit YejF
MHQGELVEQGERDQMLTAPKSQAMQSLLAAAQSY